jgi:hypothetical protein
MHLLRGRGVTLGYSGARSSSSGWWRRLRSTSSTW